MRSLTIEKLLALRGAWPKGISGDMTTAHHRAKLSQMIASDYMHFEHLRDLMFKLVSATTREEHELIYAHPDMKPLMQLMAEVKLVAEHYHGGVKLDARAKRYLSGGWLEELSYLAALEAGAEEALYGQAVGWKFREYTGENEIDLIMRVGSKLTLVSCKALKSHLDANDRKLRNKLMEAVHEADNLADHFGRHGEKVALVVSTELFDQVRKVPRYQSLLGKAAVLDVHIIALEEMDWDKLVLAMQGLLA